MGRAFDVNDVMALENGDGDEFEQAAALQRAINSGMWSLQGSYGRAMMGAIEAGYCMLGKHDARDYWGNHIPSRTQVQPGTKGSREFVADRMGAQWAEALEVL